MKSLIIMLLTGAITLQVAAPQVIKIVCPILRAAVQHQEDTVVTYEQQFPQSTGPAIARAEWEPKKTIALEKIAALEALGQEITLLPETDPIFVDQAENQPENQQP